MLRGSSPCVCCGVVPPESPSSGGTAGRPGACAGGWGRAQRRPRRGAPRAARAAPAAVEWKEQLFDISRARAAACGCRVGPWQTAAANLVRCKHQCG